jgi:hypothetical protein
VRIALGPEGRLAPDVAAKLPGRGAWVRAERAAVEAAVKRNAFARALKQPVGDASTLADAIEARLAARCLDLLGLGAKAGALAVGFEQVDAAIRSGAARSLVEASDGAEESRNKLLRLYFGLRGEEPELTGCFSAAELAMALGRDHVVHLAWLPERMERRWAVESARLAGFRALTPATWRTRAAQSDR